MNASLFALSLAIGVAGPAIAITYLRPILARVLRLLCDADGGAEFWIRSAYLLAISGTLLLMLTFGQFEAHRSPIESLQRALWLVLAGVFATIAIISRNVWSQVRAWLKRNEPAQPAAAVSPISA